MLKAKVALVVFICSLQAFDNPHFYKASQFLYKPRFEEPYLTTFSALLAGGTTKTSFNNDHEQTPLLNIYGPQNIQFLTKNVPPVILEKNSNHFLDTLWQKKVGACFAQLEFLGDFKIVDVNFDYAQNAENGLFIEFNIPVRRLMLSEINFNDLSSSRYAQDVDMKDWQQLIENFSTTLQLYGIDYHKNIERGGFGDLAIVIGKTVNYEGTKKLDFIDATLKFGILCPTGKKTNPDILFDLPTGYDGFWGAPIMSALTMGLFEWVTIGGYLNFLPFYPKTKCIRIKTDCEQNGPIKLAKTKAKVFKGMITTLGFYFEADHFTKGFSIFFGYQMNQEQRTTLSPQHQFDADIANSDTALNGWLMNTINFYIEYDFADHENPNRPQVRLGIDIPAHGKNIFDTKMGTVYLNADLNYSF